MNRRSTISTADYRKAFEDWFRVAPGGQIDALGIAGLLQPQLATLPDGEHPIEALCAKVAEGIDRWALMPVWKSNYLWRRIYLGQAHRTEPCPSCKGRWGRRLFEGCGCGGTGWLPPTEAHEDVRS